MVRTPFSVEKYGATQPGKLILVYIETSRSGGVSESRFGTRGAVGLSASFTSFTFFSGMRRANPVLPTLLVREHPLRTEAYSHSSWAQKQNAMIERAGTKYHREDEPITKMRIGSSSRLVVDKQPSQLL
jgi:hypothetical protein